MRTAVRNSAIPFCTSTPPLLNQQDTQTEVSFRTLRLEPCEVAVDTQRRIGIASTLKRGGQKKQSLRIIRFDFKRSPKGLYRSHEIAHAI